MTHNYSRGMKEQMGHECLWGKMWDLYCHFINSTRKMYAEYVRFVFPGKEMQIYGICRLSVSVAKVYIVDMKLYVVGWDNHDDMRLYDLSTGFFTMDDGWTLYLWNDAGLF